MPSQDYPQNYLNQVRPELTSLENDFVDWVLDTRVWTMRLIIAFAALATVWRLGSGLPVYASSVIVSIVVNSIAVLALLASVPWKNRLPLQSFAVRLLLSVMLLGCAYHMVSISGMAPMWTLTLMIIGVVVQLDEPGDDRLLRRWSGSLLAIMVVIASLGILPAIENTPDIELFKRWSIVLGIVICVSVYAWHQVFYFQKILGQSSSKEQAWWQSKTADLLLQFKYVNPLLVLVMLTVVILVSILSAFFLSWEASIIAAIGRLHQPLLVAILGVMFGAFLLAVKPSVNRLLGPLLFVFLSLILLWEMANDNGFHTPMIVLPFVVLQFFQPPQRRWLALSISCIHISLYLYWNIDQLLSSEVLVLGMATLICCVFIFDKLRQCHLQQLSVLTYLSKNANPNAEQDFSCKNDPQPWFQNIKHWYLVAATIVIVMSSIGYYTFQFKHRHLVDVLRLEMKNKTALEMARLSSDLQLAVFAGDKIDDATDKLYGDYWCGIDFANIHHDTQAKHNGCLDRLSDTSQAMIQSMPLGGIAIVRFEGVTNFYLKTKVDDGRIVIGQLQFDRWMSQILLPKPIHENYDVLLFLDSKSPKRLGKFDFLSNQLRFDVDENAVNVSGDNLALIPTLKPDALTYYVLGLMQVVLIIMLVMALLRNFYNSRSNYLRVSTALEQSEKALDVDRELRQELANALHRAEDANKAKDQFLGVIGHEIRTPLNSVMGMLQALSLQSLPDSAKQLVRSAYSGSHVLLNLVNDVLDYAKIQSGALSLYQRPFSIGHLVNLYYQQYLPSATAKGLTFKCQFKGDKKVMLIGDEMRIGQILANLLSNAIKFTSVGEVIFQVDVVGDDHAKRCVFRIIDTGPGIEKKQQSELFEPFVQLDMSLKREHRGAGLGLSIAKRLAELMAGRIDVSSRRGKGSTFSLSLELKVSDDTSSMPTITDFDFEPPEAIYRGVRILVVDDDALNLDVIGELLEPYGVEVDCAQTAQQALAKVADVGKEYAFILMDHQMPDMTGLEQTYRIRETFTTSELPIILLTADLSDKVQLLSVKAGSNEAIAKPIKLKALLRLLDHYRR